MSAREVVKILEDHGFTKVRQRGSHIAMQQVDGDGMTTTVIVPDHKEIGLGTLQSIIRQSGPPRQLFEA